MKTQLILLSFVIVGLCAKAQTIEKFSIDNGGASVTNGNTQILYTIGEVNVQETVMGNILLSEGFINPAGNGETLSTNHGVLSENIKVFPNPASETLNISS
ncbi:MAG TPA: hypothetical protein VKZ97_04185, partial [Flavobacteriaceae bacterium]|nr:hypothetical protein [Flavobacteriaceae bacterium]